jgi:hypothetical protein
MQPPNGAPSFPRDYADYLPTMGGRPRHLPRTELFCEPKDPGMALGRQGSENFQCSALIGRRTDGLFPIVMYAQLEAYGPEVWQYCITGGAEWDVVMTFPDFASMLAYLENERPY